MPAVRMQFGITGAFVGPLSGSGFGPAFGPGSVQNAIIKLCAWGGPTNGSRFSTLNSCFSQFTGALVSAGKWCPKTPVSRSVTKPDRIEMLLQPVIETTSLAIRGPSEVSG